MCVSMPSFRHCWYMCITIDCGISNIRTCLEKDYPSLYHVTFEFRYNIDELVKAYITAFGVCHQLHTEQQYDAKQIKLALRNAFATDCFLVKNQFR